MPQSEVQRLARQLSNRNSPAPGRWSAVSEAGSGREKCVTGVNSRLIPRVPPLSRLRTLRYEGTRARAYHCTEAGERAGMIRRRDRIDVRHPVRYSTDTRPTSVVLA